MKAPTLALELLDRIDAYWRAANYLSVGQIFHLVMDTLDRVPAAGDKGTALKKQLQDKLIEHKRYIDENGQDLPEIRNWKWPS